MPQAPLQAALPRPVAGCDLRSLPLTPTQAYVLSRIDGTVTLSELALMTGLDARDVHQTLEHLAKLGAIEWAGAQRTTESSGVHSPPRSTAPESGPTRRADTLRSSPPQSSVRADPMRAARSETLRSSTRRPTGGQELHSETLRSSPLREGENGPKRRYDPSELEEPDVDLTPEKRLEVLDLFYRLDELSFYELLNVEPTSDKRTIKAGYYRLAPEYHPDRFFRKRLGNFKTKMEAIFSRITLAHDTLVREESRGEYDTYLNTQRHNQHIERMLQQAAEELELEPEPERPAPSQRDERVQALGLSAETHRARRVSSVQQPSAEPMRDLLFGQLREPLAAATVPPPSEITERSITERNAPEGRPSPTRRSATSPEADTPERVRARKEALAARLTAGRVSRVPPPTSGGRNTTGVPPSSDEPGALPAEQAAQALRQHMVSRREQAKNKQLQRYMEAAEEALRRNDPATAANAYRLALTIAPEDEQLRLASERAQDKAAAMLADGYLRQAEYEERADRWKEAARSYMRAAQGMKDVAHVQGLTARAMLRADMDLRQASEYAKRAIALDPKNASYHATLGQIYLAGGLHLNARRELEQATELAPGDATIAKLLQAVRKS